MTGDDDDDGQWVEAGRIDNTVDLLALPEEGVEVLDSHLPEGRYTGLRFFLTGPAIITLAEEVTIGRTTFEAGPHTLVIPSADETGVKLKADFVVDEDGEVLTVLFDGDATVRHVTATGAGDLKISPVLTVYDEDGDDVGEFDDDDDDEDEVEAEGVVQSVGDNGFTLQDGTVVLITDETELEGDILSLAALAEAVNNGEVVEAEVEGRYADDGTTLIADEVEFETDDDDGDGDDDDEDEEVEVEGLVTDMDRDDFTLTVNDDGRTVTVLIVEGTELELEGFTSWDDAVDAFDDGAAIEAEAEGKLDADGRLIANEVELERKD